MSFGNIVGSASFQLLTGKRGFTLGLQDAQGEAQDAVSKIGNTLAGLGRSASQAGLALTGGLTAPLVGLSTAVFEIGSSFETAFTGVAKTFPGTIEQLGQFREAIRDMANEMPSTREEISAVAEAAGQLGISATGLEDFTRTMIQLGETTNLSASEAATNLARLANIMQTNEADFDRLGATVVDLGNNFATTEAEIVNMATRIAGAGQVVGLTEAQVLSLATALSSVGVRIEAGGSAISRVFITMANAVAQGSGDIELFAQVAGTSVQGFADAFENDAAQALQLFLGGLKQIQDEGGNVFTTLDDLELGEIRVRDALLRLASAQDVMNGALATGDQAWIDNTALIEEYGKRVETIDSQIQILKNQFTDIAVELFDAFRPEIVAIIGKISDAIKGLTDRVKDFAAGLDSETKQLILTIAGVAAAIGPVLLAIGGIGIALATLANPIALVLVALSGLVAAFIVLDQNAGFFEQRMPNLIAQIEALKGSFSGLTEAVGDFGEALDQDVEQEGIQNLRGDTIGLEEVIRATGQTVQSFFQLFLAGITTTINGVSLLIESAQLLLEVFNPDNFEISKVGPIPIITGFDPSDIQKQAGDVKEAGSRLGQDFVTGFSNAIDTYWNGNEIQSKLERQFGDLNLEGFRDVFEETANGGIESFALMKAQILSDFIDLETEGGDRMVELLRTTQTEAQLTAVLFEGLIQGVITEYDLGIKKTEEFTLANKFLEENIFTVEGSVNKVTEAINYQAQAADNALAAILIYKDGITTAQNAIGIWNKDLQDNEKAIEITKRLIEETGDPTGELAKQLEVLTWQNGRLANGISDDLEPAFAKAVAAGADLQLQLDNLDKQFEDGDINAEQYAQLTEAIKENAEDTQDPFAQMVGDIGKIAEAMQTGIEAFKDLLRELGLLKDESGDPIEANFTTNATDTAEDIENVGRVVEEEVPDEKTVSILSVLSGQAELDDYQGELRDLPPEVLTKLLADPRNADANTQAAIEKALVFANGDYKAQLYADTAEANESVADLSKNTIGFVEGGPYEFELNADDADAAAKLEEADTTLFGLTSGTYTITIGGNIEPFKAAVTEARAYAPQSPAEKGPLAFTPSWDWMFEGIVDAAGTYSDEGMNRVKTFVDTAQAAVNLLTSSFDALTKIFSGGEGLPNLGSIGSENFLDPLYDFVGGVTSGMTELSTAFREDALTHANAFIQTANSAVDVISSGYDALVKILEGPALPELSTVGSEDFLDPIFDFIGNVTSGVAELGTAFTPESLAIVQVFATASSTVLDLITKGAETLAALGGARPNLAKALDAVSDIKFVIESSMLAIGDTAAVMNSSQGDVDHPSARGEGFVGAAEVFAQSAKTVLDLMTAGVGFISELSNFGGSFNLDSALEFITKLKFVIEHMMLSMGDTAAVMNSSQGEVDHPAARGEGFVGAAKAFAESAESVLGLMSSGLEFIAAMAEFGSTFNLADSMDFASKLKFLIEHIVLSIGDTVQYLETIRDSGFLDGIEEFSNIVSTAVGSMADVLGFLVELSENVEAISLSTDDVHAHAAALAGIALDLADLFNAVAEIWSQSGGESIEGSIESLSGAVGSAVGAFSDTLGFIVELGNQVNSITLSSEQTHAHAAALAGVALDLADLFNTVARIWAEDGGETIAGSIEKLSTAVGSAVTAFSETLGFLINLSENIDKITVSTEDAHAYAAGLAGVALDLADLFNTIARVWSDNGGETVKGSIDALSTAVGSSVGALSSTFGFLIDLSENIDKVTISSDRVREYVSELADRAVEIAEAFNEVASEWDGKVAPEAEALVKVIGDATGTIGNVLSFLGSLTDAFAREDKIDFGANIRGIATLLAERGREAAEAFIDVINTWTVEEEVKTKVEDAAKVIQDSFGALNAVISFMNAISEEGFTIRGGQLRTAARTIAELGVNVGNIFAQVGGSLSEDSRAGLDAYAQWFSNIQGIFDFLADIQSKTPDAIQNAYTFRDAAREIAAAIQTGTDALLSIGELSELSYGGGYTPPSSNFNPNEASPSGPPNFAGAKEITVHLDIDGETFETFIIDTVNESIEETF